MEYERENAVISEESFDEFLAALELLDACEREAIKEIAADQEQNP